MKLVFESNNFFLKTKFVNVISFLRRNYKLVIKNISVMNVLYIIYMIVSFV
jgi:hypothetical protein